MSWLIAITAMLQAAALCSPIDRRPSGLSTRNSNMIAAGTPMLFKFKPGIVNAMCSDVHATQISVQYTTDDFTLDDNCRDFLNLIGGLKAKIDVDVVFVCQGAEPKGTGNDENKLKVMFFVAGDRIKDGKTKDTQWLDVLLQATSITKNKVVSTPARVGLNVNDQNGFTINQLTC